MVDDNILITAKHLADELNLSVDTIWRYTRENKIPFIKLGNRQYRYNLKSVIATLRFPNVVMEQRVEYVPKQDEKYTYKDYLEMPAEPGFKLEILDGVLVKEPAPNIIHQNIIGELYLLLRGYFESHDPEGYVFLSPLDVTFRESTVVQPDLIYISGKKKGLIKVNRVDGAPTLAVEVVSLSSRRADRLQKLQIYQREGVEHYFIVSPEDKSFECYQLREGVYALIASGMDDDVISHPIYVGLNISLELLWKKPYMRE